MNNQQTIIARLFGQLAAWWLADHADIHNGWDALAFLLCGACTVALGAMAAYIAGWL